MLTGIAQGGRARRRASAPGDRILVNAVRALVTNTWRDRSSSLGRPPGESVQVDVEFARIEQ